MKTRIGILVNIEWEIGEKDPQQEALHWLHAAIMDGVPTSDYCRVDANIMHGTITIERNSKQRRLIIHYNGHGSYYPGPCEECINLGWNDIA